MSLYKSEPVRILGIREETSDTRTYILDRVISAQPDQFYQVSLPEVGECPISICSAPGENLEFTIRKTGKVTSAISTMRTGESIYIRGPYGHGIPVDKFEGKHIYLIAGGSGLAPLRGVIKYFQSNIEKFGGMTLFAGFKTRADILFKYEIELWQKNFNVHLTLDTADGNWNGNVGLITKTISEKGINNKNSVAVLCGPPLMIHHTAILLEKELGLDEKEIWVSLERHMKCGIGKCGRCRVEASYVCQDGPVFNYAVAKTMLD